MGCKQSLPIDTSKFFKAQNVNEKDRSSRSVILEVKHQRLVIYNRRLRKQLASWPILALRKYGCNKDCLVIETNTTCDNGAGTYIFKLARAQELFRMVADVWQEIHEKRVQLMHQQNQINNVMFNPGLFRHQQQTGQIPSVKPHNYYNTNNSSASCSNGNHVITPRGFGSGAMYGSSSSRGNIPNFLENEPLNSSQRSVLGPTFELQPAPATREEMLHRRRINSGVTFCRDSESVFLGAQRPRHRSALPEADYQNNEIIQRHDGSKFSPMSYDPQEIIMEDSPDSDHPPTTPGSNGTSGISSLNGNSTTSETKSQTQYSLDDPWRPKPSISRSASAKKHRNRFILRPNNDLFANMPMSAREYVNTANASMDVSGTPIPATAMVGGGTHFNFDFDHHSYSVSSSCGNSHKNLNYVPIEVSMKNGGFYSCGTSSASSGLGPATPVTVTPPPKTPNSHSSTNYTIIDHHKTRALSDAHKHRQRERKSCRKNSETRPMLT